MTYVSQKDMRMECGNNQAVREAFMKTAEEEMSSVVGLTVVKPKVSSREYTIIHAFPFGFGRYYAVRNKDGDVYSTDGNSFIVVSDDASVGERFRTIHLGLRIVASVLDKGLTTFDYRDCREWFRGHAYSKQLNEALRYISELGWVTPYPRDEGDNIATQYRVLKAVPTTIH